MKQKPIITREGPVGQRIWQACVDMHATGRTITRQKLELTTGLKLTVIDDHVKRMKAEQKLHMIVPGVYEPALTLREDRPISTTILPDSMDPVKVEIGDLVLELSWREARNLGISLAGIGLLFRG